jgi:ethanolamine ammonia-lyase small subunit
MKREDDLSTRDDSDFATLVRERTPARLLVGRVGAAYTTATQLQLRADHAAARDAVSSELDLQRDLGQEFIERWKLFEVRTRCRNRSEYLLHPALGRDFDEPTRQEIAAHCPPGADLQIAIGDGLSSAAIAAQVPELFPRIMAEAERRGWSVGQTFVIRHCRVGIMNAIGEILRPRVVVLLIGERPGLSVADGLSAYMAFQPQARHTDADRNLICNIHAQGVSIPEASARIIGLAGELMRAKRSGASIKEPPMSDLPS